MVQDHGKVTSELLLDRHRPLGRELNTLPVYVRSEVSGVVSDLRVRCEAEDLKSTAIGQNWPVPTHERVQTT